MNEFADKVLLITGGTGSFGKAILRRFVRSQLREIRIFSRDEKKQDDLRRKVSSAKVKFYIGDVRDYQSVHHAAEGVDYIFHAAALKQVPSCEFFPMEAVRTNILGTENVIRAAIASGVKKFVGLSTDKAVYPINAMGLSKALMEKVVVANSRNLPNGTLLCCTRYGNVMGSRGSVIPLFIEQIKAGGALTVTDPNMTRFMMSLSDAVDLVLHAFTHGRQGDIFIQKAPACTIGDLARAMIELYGASSEVRVIGTRHGEKLYETLVTREEMSRAEDQDLYFRVPTDTRTLNYEQYFSRGTPKLSEATDYTSHNTTRLDVEATKRLLCSLSIIRRDCAAAAAKYY